MSLLRPKPFSDGLFMGGEQGEILARRLFVDLQLGESIES
jgi:hypothetical protein